MDTLLLTLLASIAAFLTGAAVVWAFLSARTRATVDKSQRECARLEAELAALQARMEEREAAFGQQREHAEKHFEQQRAALKNEFEALANRIFEQRGKSFSENSKTQLGNLLAPFKQQVEGFQKRVNEIHEASVRGQANLGAEIRKVLEVGLAMQSEANNLTSALKGDSQRRGAWGEAQLERTLEMSGLIKGAHYEGQETFRDSGGKIKRTDYVIKLPDGKHIVIDSKVALNAYDDLIGADSEEAAQRALSAHVQAVKGHIEGLAAKDYSSLPGLDSPGFVLMFMPVEPAYIEALKHEKDLFAFGYTRGVVLVSHTTLLPILTTVANLWALDRSNREAGELGDRAVDIYNQVALVSERLFSLGGTLNTVGKHYTSIVTAMAGQKGLYNKIERFGQLSSKLRKQLPDLQPVHLDVEDARLQMEATALEQLEAEPDHEVVASADEADAH